MKSIYLPFGLMIYSIGLYAQSDYALFPNDSVTYESEHFEFPTIIQGYDTLDGIVFQKLHPTYNQKLNNPNNILSDYMECDTLYGWCLEWKNAHWLGDSLQFNTDGMYTFINQRDELFYIHSRAEVDSSWVFYSFEYGQKIEARVDSIGYISSVDIGDSVKYISLQRKDDNGLDVFGSINNFQILIGKNRGLIESPYFLDYPGPCDWIDGFFGEAYPVIELFKYKGKVPNNPSIESTNRFKIWNRNIGDEYHYYLRENNGTPIRFQIIIIEKEWSQELSRFIYQKQIKWSEGEYQLGEDYIFQTINEDNSIDTIYLSDYTFLDTVLVGINLDGETPEFAKSLYNDSLFEVGKQLNRFMVDSTSTWCDGQFNVFGRFDHYVEGVGGPFYGYGSDIGYSYIKRLEYIKKGNYIWGAAYNLSQGEITSFGVEVYPNPASSTIHINLQKQGMGQIQLLDILGRNIQDLSIENGKTEYSLSVSNYPSGVYFIRVFQNGSELTTEKIIIQ